jgi:hypothetical protein
MCQTSPQGVHTPEPTPLEKKLYAFALPTATGYVHLLLGQSYISTNGLHVQAKIDMRMRVKILEDNFTRLNDVINK